MRTWLLAAILASAVIPPAALLMAAHSGAADALERARDGLGDALVDAPGAPGGLIAGSGTLATAVATQPFVSQATRTLAGPASIERGGVRRVVRLEGLWPRSSRLSRLARLVTVGRIDPLAAGRGVALGEPLAAELGLRPGDEVTVTGLAPGPRALGFRRRSLEVSALYRSSLAGLDRETALVSVETARGLLASGEAASGVVAWLAEPLPAAEAEARLAGVVDDAHRARHRERRDRPEVDAGALISAARSTMVLALIAALLSAALAGPPTARRRPYGELLRRTAVPAGLAIVVAAALGVAMAAIAAGGVGEGLRAARGDLGRLLAAGALGALVAPLLVGRVRRGATGLVGAFLILLVGLATTEPTAAAVVAAGARRAVAAPGRAARDLARAAAYAPLPAAVSLGAEVVPIDLVGVDPARRDAMALLRRLSGSGEVPLRPAGAARPRRTKAAAGIDDLLDQLATQGAGATARPEPQPEAADEAPAAAPGPPPGLVIGSGVARRLGARRGDQVTVAAAPAGMSADEEPPWPVTFTVAAVAELGLGSLDGRLAVADVWQVEALGASGPRRGFTASDAAAWRRAASAPFEALARRCASAAALQIALVAFLLGALLGGGPRRWGAVALCALAGVALGVTMGVSEAMRGMVAIGDASWYEALPSGQVWATDVLSPWPFLPALVALAAAALGTLLGVGGRDAREADH